MKAFKNYELYERCVAAWAIEEFDFVDITVTANAKIKGVISERSRQIDVLLEDRTNVFGSHHGLQLCHIIVYRLFLFKRPISSIMRRLLSSKYPNIFCLK